MVVVMPDKVKRVMPKTANRYRPTSDSFGDRLAEYAKTGRIETELTIA
jgi:hypothetical protein